MQIGGRDIFSARSISDHPVFAAEAEISEQHIDLLALEHVHRAGDVGGDVHVVIVLEQTTQSVARMLLVVNDQDRGLRSVGPYSYRQERQVHRDSNISWLPRIPRWKELCDSVALRRKRCIIARCFAASCRVWDRSCLYPVRTHSPPTSPAREPERGLETRGR